jgi:hypothetical protein
MILLCVAYFIAGLVRDAMAAYYYQAVSAARAPLAGGSGGVLTAYDIAILGMLIHRWSVPLIMCYSLGTAIGTYIVVKFNSKED